jgi:pimeloyl-ACP methyl ester carboxylesterase
VSLLAPALCLRTGVTPALNVLRLLPWPRNVGRRDAGLPGRPAYGPIPVRAACSLLELVEVTTAVARPLAAPVLVMQGSRDLSVPCGPNLKRVEALLGHAPRLEVVAGAGHVLLREEGAASRVIEAVVAAGIRS